MRRNRLNNLIDMKISELIKVLHEYEINYGDWDVYISTTKGGHLIDEIDLFVDCSMQRLEIIP